jgi:hypothetical protein
LKLIVDNRRKTSTGSVDSICVPPTFYGGLIAPAQENQLFVCDPFFKIGNCAVDEVEFIGCFPRGILKGTKQIQAVTIGAVLFFLQPSPACFSSLNHERLVPVLYRE